MLQLKTSNPTFENSILRKMFSFFLHIFEFQIPLTYAVNKQHIPPLRLLRFSLRRLY